MSVADRALADDLPPGAVWAAEIATVDSDERTCTVRIRGIDGGQHRHGPCPYLPVPGDPDPRHPDRDDAAVVLEDDRGGLWVACWTPA